MKVPDAEGTPPGASCAPATAGPAGRAGALLMGVTASLVLVTWLLTLRDASTVSFAPSVVAMLCLMVALSPIAYRWAAGWPAPLIHVLAGACAVAITHAIVGAPSLAPQIAGLYVIDVIFASYYLARRAAQAIVAVCTVCLAAALAWLPAGVAAPSPTSVESWLPIAGTIVIVGGLLTTVRRHRDGLVEERHSLQTQLEVSSRTDALTGLLNRDGFAHRAMEELAGSDGHSAALLVGDVDLLRALNDAHGTDAGDRALRRVAEVVASTSRRLDIVGRIGGEEFAILVPTSEVSDAVALAERVRRDVILAFGDEPFALTISLGIAMYPRDGHTLDALLGSADRALLTAKRSGRNRTMLAAQAGALIMESTRDEEHDERARLVTAIGLAEALDLRDTGTASHSQTVSHYAALMARELGLDDQEVDRIRVAGLLHDIGKIGVPDAILNKPGKLTDHEYSEMQRHPEIGARILGSDVLDDVRAWVLAHHERPDGHGYPFGLAGDQVPLQARILAVADAYEAMTADRVYRTALGPQVARAELERCRGTQFDPVVIDAFLRLLDREEAAPSAAPRRLAA